MSSNRPPGCLDENTTKKKQKDTERQIRAWKCADMKIVCSPIRYAKTLQVLSEAHKDAIIAKTGLGGMLHLKPVTLRRIMIVDIVDRFCVQNQLFSLCGAEIPMTGPDVYHIMGIPIEGTEITLDSNTEVNKDLFLTYRSTEITLDSNTEVNKDLFLTYRSTTPGENHITLKSLEQSIRNSQVPDDHFIRQFVLYTIGLILSPTSKDYVDAKYLVIVEKVSDIQQYNWGQFTLNSLLGSISNFKLGKQTNLQGNLALLQYWYWEYIHSYSKHGVSYTPAPHPLMQRWDEKNSKLRTDAYEADELDGGVVVMKLSSQKAPVNTTTNKTTKLSTEGRQPHEIDKRVHIGHSTEPSMTNQQVDIVLEAITKNRLLMERAVLEMENKICSRILTLEEQLAEHKMHCTVHTRLCNVENGIKDIGKDIQEISSALHNIKTSPVEGHQNVQEEANRQSKENLTNSHNTVDPAPFGLDSECKKDHETAAKKQTPIPMSNTCMPTTKPVPEQLCNLQDSTDGLGSTIENSLLASKPLLRKTGGHDINAQQSLLYLYTNEKHENHSTEFLVFDNDYILSEEDKEAVNFIKHSYEFAVVVDIADILLPVRFLRPHVEDKWLYDSVIDAYAFISNVEKQYTSVITTFQSCELSEQHGEFDPKKERTWICSIGQRCATRQMVFVPFNVWGCHWCLLVVNKTRNEIQILNSLAKVPQFNNEKMIKTLVKTLQACIQQACEEGYLDNDESIDLTQWSIQSYANIPQQNDSTSCGAYVVKYMMEWNGYEMRHNFSEDEMKIFKIKMCCRLLRSECNNKRRTSYKEPITKQKYLAENPQYRPDVQGVGLDDDACMVIPEGETNKKKLHNSNKLTSTESLKKKQPKQSQVQKKRGRPRKNGQNTKVADNKQDPENIIENAPKRVRGDNQRVSNPSQYKLSPYKQI